MLQWHTVLFDASPIDVAVRQELPTRHSSCRAVHPVPYILITGAFTVRVL